MKFSGPIGGAIVARRFKMGADWVGPGTSLTAAQVSSIPAANRNSLVNKEYIHLFPAGAAPGNAATRFIVNRGFGKFDVVEGVLLNPEPLTKAEAEVLVAGPPEAAKSAA